MKRSAGQVGFDAYGEAADWKTFDGRPMPRWADMLGEDWEVVG